jgi:hypothetical protein
MKNQLLIFFVFICAIQIASSQTWEFIPNSEFVIAKSTLFSNYEPWIPTDMVCYNGNIVISRSLYGVAIYKDRKWTYWTPAFIKSHIINEDVLNKIKFNYANIYQLRVDADNNLWLLADNYLLKYNSEGFYCYNTYLDSNNNINDIETLNGINIANNTVYLKVIGYDKTNPMNLQVLNCKINQNNQIEEIYSFKYSNEDISQRFQNQIYEFYYDSLGNFTKDNFGVTFSIADSLMNFETINFQDLFGYYHYQNIADVFKHRNDTIFVIDNQFVIGKLLNRKPIGYDSVINKIEMKYSNNPTQAVNTINSIETKSDINGNLYFLPYSSESLLDGARIYKYKGYNNAEEILIPNLPGQTSAMPASNFAIDSLGRIWLIYSDYGIYIYYPAGLGVDNEINVEYYPRIWIWNLYPNPANETARVEFHLTRDVKDECKIQIIDVMGNIIKEIKNQIEYDFTQQEAIVNFSTADIACGIYYVSISSSKSRKLRQLQIIR